MAVDQKLENPRGDSSPNTDGRNSKKVFHNKSDIPGRGGTLRTGRKQTNRFYRKI